MPKLKTHKPTSKRFRRTKGGKGKLVRTRAGKGHLRRNKRKSHKRKLYRMKVVKHNGLRDRVRTLLPNNSSLDIRHQSPAEQAEAPYEEDETGTTSE